MSTTPEVTEDTPPIRVTRFGEAVYVNGFLWAVGNAGDDQANLAHAAEIERKLTEDGVQAWGERIEDWS